MHTLTPWSKLNFTPPDHLNKWDIGKRKLKHTQTVGFNHAKSDTMAKRPQVNPNVVKVEGRSTHNG